MDDQLRQRIAKLLQVQRLPAPAAPVASPRVAISSGPEIVRFEMWCSVTGLTFVVVAERNGNVLSMKRNELPTQGGAGGGASSSTALGNFGLAADALWPGCPHCGTKKNLQGGPRLAWVCNETGCGSPIHCAGNREGRYRCACGIVEVGNFVTVETVPVHGAPPPRSAAAVGRSGPANTAALPRPSAGALPPPSARLDFKRR